MKINKYKLLTLIGVLVIILAVLILKLPNKYFNSEYNYHFYYPRDAKVSIISSYFGNPSIETVDTLAVEYTSGEILRIQAFDLKTNIPSDLCGYFIQNNINKICLSTKGDDLLTNPKYKSVIKSIKF